MAQLSPPSMNNVILAGRVVAAPEVHLEGSGRTCSVQVETVSADRVVLHRVKIVDEFLAQSLHGHLAEGASVTILGELDYDAAGAFVSVPSRRGCDIQVSSRHSVQSAAVASKPASAPVMQTQTIAPVRTPPVSAAAEPAVVTREVAEPQGESNTVVKEEAPATASESAPSTASPARAPMRPGMRRGVGGLGSLGSRSQRDTSVDDSPGADEPAQATASPAHGAGFQPPEGYSRGAAGISRSAPQAIYAPDQDEDQIPF